MGWNPFNDISNLISDVAGGVNHVVDEAVSHPWETAALAGMAFGLPPMLADAGVAGSLTGEGALASYEAMDAAYGMAGVGGGAAAFPVAVGGADITAALSSAVGPGISAGGGASLGGTGAGLSAGGASLGGGAGGFAGSASGSATGLPGALLGSGGGGTSSTWGLGQWAQLGSSLYGLYQGNQMQQMGQNADPFAPYRGGYAQQLQQLMANPSSVTSLPGYQAGLGQAEQTLTRQSASQGLTGSGTTAAALANLGANYQGQFFQQQLQNLSGLAGAGSTGAGGNMAGFAAGANTQNQSIQNLIKLLPALSGGG